MPITVTKDGQFLDAPEYQKTIHILTEQREDYRKQVVFLEAQIKALRSMAENQMTEE